MTRLFPVQRAAEEFDRTLAGTAEPGVADRYAELVGAVQMLRTAPEVAPRRDFVLDLRERLMLEAETALAPAVVPDKLRLPDRAVRRPRSQQHRRRFGTVAAALVIVGGSAGMAAAANGANPGQPLYPIKRSLENVSTAAHMGDASKGRSLLGQASTRLDEVRTMVSSGDPDPRQVQRTVADFQTAAAAGSDKLFEAYQRDGNAADIASVREFASDRMDLLSSLSTKVGAGTAALLTDAVDTLADIDQQARVLCGGCGQGGPLAPPAGLSSASQIGSLISTPIAVAGQQVQALQQAQANQQMTDLSQAAEQAAERQRLEQLANRPGGILAGTTGTQPAATPGAGVVTTLTETAKVNQLVQGVTGTLKGTLAGTPLGPVTTPLIDVVDGVVTGLTDTLDGVTGGLTGGLLR